MEVGSAYCGCDDTLEGKMPREGDCAASGGSLCMQSLTVGNGRGGKCVVSVVSGQQKHWYLRCDCFCSQWGSRNIGICAVIVSVVSAAAETLVFTL